MTVTLDRSQLPVAARQKPDWAAFYALNTKAKAAGERWAAPTTGLPNYKVSDASHPAGNVGMATPYSSGGLHWSWPWGPNGDMYTHYIEESVPGTGYLVDVQRGVGPSNWRRAGASNDWNSDLRGTFSYNPATPQIAYYTNGLTLYRLDTSTNPGTLAPSGNFPKDFSALSAYGSQPQHVQTDKNDRWFVFALGNDTVVAWDSQSPDSASNPLVLTGIAAALGHAFDEPHFDKGGRHVLLALASGENLAQWDLATDTFATPVPGANWSHTEALDGIFIGANSSNGCEQRYVPGALAGGRAASPVAPTGTLTSTFTDSQFGASVGGSHRSGQYVAQGAIGSAQVAIIDVNAVNGRVTVGAYSLVSGSKWSATVSYAYQQSVTGVDDVLEMSLDGTTIANRLTKAASVAAMVAGSFNISGTTVTVWRTDGNQPDLPVAGTGTVSCTGGAAVFSSPQVLWIGMPVKVGATTYTVTSVTNSTHCGLSTSPTFAASAFSLFPYLPIVKVPQVVDDAIASVKLDGTDTRIAGHHFSFWNGYPTEPHTTQSPDGVMVSYTSNQGDKSNRIDVTVIEMPTTGATATQLLLSTQPAGAVSGIAMSQQPVVAIADAGGSTVTSDTSTVTAEWISLTGDATPSGTLTKAAVSGVAAFTDLGLSWTVASTGKWRFTDGALTLVESAVMTLPVGPLTYVPIVF